MAKYLNVIIVCNLPGGGNQFLKYHNVIATAQKLTGLLKFAQRIPDVHHINVYEKRSKGFVGQVNKKQITDAELPPWFH